MCEVYMFPRKKELPKSIKEEVEKSAKGYIDAIYASLMLLCGENYSTEDMDEVLALVNIAYEEGLMKAVENLEKEL